MRLLLMGLLHMSCCDCSKLFDDDINGGDCNRNGDSNRSALLSLDFPLESQRCPPLCPPLVSLQSTEPSKFKDVSLGAVI